MAQQNIYEINGSTDAITFYSSTQYGPPVGVDLNTGQQQMGNQIASQNIKGPLDIIGIIEQASANSVNRIAEYIRQWSAEAGQAYQNFRQAQDANTSQQIGELSRNVSRGLGAAQEIIGAGRAAVGTAIAGGKLLDLGFDQVFYPERVTKEKVETAAEEFFGGGNTTVGRQNLNNFNDTVGIIRRNNAQTGFNTSTFDGFENAFNRQYERVTTGYESQFLDQWQNPTLEPGWKSSDPYDPTKRPRSTGTYNLNGAQRVMRGGGNYTPYANGTLFTGR